MDIAYSYFPGFDMYEPRDKEISLKAWQDQVSKQSIDYAISRQLGRRAKQLIKINRLMDSYNGIVDEKGMQWLNSTYGKQNLSRYIDYRLARTKIDLIHGEWLKRPLNATVYTINREAQSEKLKQFEFLTGAHQVRNQLGKLKEAGYDVMDGMPVPEPDENGKFNELDVKTKNEVIMQYLLNFQVKKLDMKTKLSANYLDAELIAECFSKTYIDENGYLQHRDIDGRDALYEEIERDPFLLQSPYLGERRIMFIQDIMTEFKNLPKDKLDMMYQLSTNPSAFSNLSEGRRSNYTLLANNLAAEVCTIEWYAIKPWFTKVVPDKKGGDPYLKDIDTDQYFDKDVQKEIARDTKKGKYKINTAYKKVVWEATRIGNDIYTAMRERPNIIANSDNPFETSMSYTGCVVNTKDGTRISLQESAENVSRMFNVTMFQIGRELAKAKGKVVAYDRAYMPKGKTMKDILHRMTNDGIYDYNSAEDGNISGAKVEINGAIKEIDLGVSQTMQVLLALKVQLQDMMDRITGVNEERSGNIQASATATNAQSAIQSSTTITEPMNYIFDRYSEMVLTKVAELTKIVWTKLHPEEGENIIGTDGIKFLRITKDLYFDAFGVYLSDSRREQEIRQLIRQYMPLAINAGEQTVHDAIAFELAETLGEAINVVKGGWEKIQAIKAQEQQNNLEAQAKNTEAQVNAMKENREDTQNSKKEEIVLKGKVDSELLNQKMKGNHITKTMQENSKENEDLTL